MMRAHGAMFARATVLATGLLLLASAVVVAHVPTEGAADQYAPNTTLNWQFQSDPNAWPTSWATPAVTAAMSRWANTSYNDSKMPLYAQTGTGQGDFKWSAFSGSPCTGDVAWIACNQPHATNALNWDIHVRDFTNAPRLNWHWDEHPSATGTLFLMQRAVLHEMIHNVLNVPSHSGQSTTDTIMQTTSPTVTAPGGLTTNIQRCDEAAAQLEYGVETSSSRFAACYDHIPNHGTLGLKTKLDVTSPDLTKCLNQLMTFTGTLSVGLDGTNYKAVSGQVLAGKTVRLERRPTSGGAWVPVASNVTSSTGTYSIGVAYTSPQTWRFHTRFDGLSPSLDLKDSAQILTGSWATTC